MVFNIKTLNEINYDIILNLMQNVSDITDANVGAVIAQLVESIATEIKALYDNLESVYEGTRVDSASGDDLDQLAKLVGIARKEGTYSNGNVTFSRNTVAPSDFTIAGGNIVSTQPNTGSDQLRFLSSSAVTFYAQISGESQTYKSGIYDYRPDERFIGNTSQVAITGLVTSAIHTFTQYQDFDIIEDFSDFLVDVSTIDEVDDCESITDWSSSVDSTAIVLSTSRRKGSYSLALGKSGVSSNDAYYSKILGTSHNGREKQLLVWMYFEDTTTIGKINRIYVYAGSGGTSANSYQFNLTRNQLYVGWKLYKFDYSNSSTIINGNPAISAINFVRMHINTVNTTDTITSGNIKMDFWNFSQTSNYTGDVVRWYTGFGVNYLPDNNSDFDMTYKPLSKEVDCYSENIGAKYNVVANKINYKVSNIPNINTVSNYNTMSGGSDTELDEDLRQRVLYATELKGRATAKAIQQSVLGVEGVQSCYVDDMPLTSASGEVHFYATGTDKYALSKEVLYLNNSVNPTNITLSGTASSSPVTFMYGTDFVAVYNSVGALTTEIEFQTAGTKPDHATPFFADYNYRWLGHVNVFVTGVENPLPSGILSEVESTVDDYKAAGIEVSITSPTVQLVDITVNITADAELGYSYNSIKDNVQEALINYLSGLRIGDAIYIAKIYDVAMGVTGMKNASITTPTADVIIDSDKVARPGTVSVLEA